MEKRLKKMKERPVTERPYEKCLEFGPEALTDGELLAILLRCGTKECSALELAWEILEKHPIYKGLAGLYHLSLESLKEIHGIGNIKAMEILSVLELSKRLSKASLSVNEDFSSPDFVAAYYMESMRHLESERVMLLLLNGKHRLLKDIVIAEGSSNYAYVPVKDIFLEAFRYEAVYVILLHNHPSGSPEPSREDLLFTRRVKDAGALLGITVSDHIIIGDKCYVSLKEQKMM